MAGQFRVSIILAVLLPLSLSVIIQPFQPAHAIGPGPADDVPPPVAAGVPSVVIDEKTGQTLGYYPDTIPTEKLGNIVNSALIDSKYKKCGQDCIYQKANDSLTQQYDLTIAELKKVKIARAIKDDAEVKNTIGDFCGIQETTGACADRFETYTALKLAKIRKRLGDNDQNIANLYCIRDSNGSCKQKPQGQFAVEMGDELAKQEQNKLDQQTYYLKSKDIADFAKAKIVASNQGSAKGNSSSKKEWIPDTKGKNQSDDTATLEPIKSDYIEFKKILRNPDDPKKGELEVPVINADGSLKLDDKKFKNAHDVWAGFVKDTNKALAGRDIDTTIKDQNTNLEKEFRDDKETYEFARKSKHYKRQLFIAQRAESVHNFQTFADWARTSGAKTQNFKAQPKPGVPPNGNAPGNLASGASSGAPPNTPLSDAELNKSTGNEAVKQKKLTDSKTSIEIVSNISGSAINIGAPGSGAAGTVNVRDLSLPPTSNAGVPNTTPTPPAVKPDANSTAAQIDLYF